MADLAARDSMDETGPRATGRCHCGSVRFSVYGRLRDVIMCHCEDCQRIHGGAAAHSGAPRADVRFENQTDLRWYDSSSVARRGFCGRCGSALFYDLHGRDVIGICAGALDPPTGTKVAMHVFMRSARDYESTDTAAPRHDLFPDQPWDIDFS